MKHHVTLVMRCERQSELPLRLIDRKTRGAEAAFFVAFRIADKHALPPPACLEMAAIQWDIEELPHRLAAALESLDRFEHRREVEGNLAAPLVVALRPAREQHHRE